ncbi:MAG: nuclear transport factor 2 family protein [Marmoricola sp.]
MSTDAEEIRDRLARIAAATDARDWDLLRTLCTPEVHGYGARGIDAMIDTMRTHLGGVGPTQHLLGNHRITVDQDEARSFSYGRVHHAGAGAFAGAFYECLGEYDDRWVRGSSGWLLRRRWFEIRIELGDRAVLRPADA